MINFPTSLDNFINPTAWQARNATWVEDYVVMGNLNDAVEALEVKIWITNSVDSNSLDYKVRNLNALTTKWDILVHTWVAYTRLPAWSSGQILATDPSVASGLKYINPTSGGTVTSVSGGTANGVTVSVINPTTTPSLAISTAINGIVKANWTGFIQAVAGTDYLDPSTFVQGNVVSVTAVWTITAGMGIYISGGNWTPTDTTTNTRCDGIALQSVASGASFLVDIWSEWKNVPGVTTGNYYTFWNSGTFSAITSPTSEQCFHCPKSGTLITVFQRKSVLLISSCANIGWANTSASVFVDKPTTISYTISNQYSTVWGALATFEGSFDNVNWTGIATETNANVSFGVTFSGAVTVNKMYVRARTSSGNSTSASITIRG